MPVTTLVFAAASLGDFREDGTLVYLWLRPVPRWQIIAAALGASITVTLPLVLVPLVVARADHLGRKRRSWPAPPAR